MPDVPGKGGSPAGEADQGRRQGRQPRPVRYLPNGRGRGVAADVRRHPHADRPAAGATRTSLTGRWEDTIELDSGNRFEYFSNKAKSIEIRPQQQIVRRHVFDRIVEVNPDLPPTGRALFL